MGDRKHQDYGIVYLLTNACMPGIVKIGKTTRKDLQQRMRELYTTGVPVPFECAYSCSVKMSHVDLLESALHNAFDPYRVNENREFFRIKPEQAIPIMKFVDGYQDVTNEVAEAIESELTDNDRIAKQKARPRRPPLNFYEMGLHDGDTLVYIEDPSVIAEVVGPKKVRFQDEDETSLTAITTKLRNSKNSIQPTPWWTYEGRNLSDIYNESYPFEEE